MKNKCEMMMLGIVTLVASLLLFGSAAHAQPQPGKPNILVIFGDDIGYMNARHAREYADYFLE